MSGTKSGESMFLNYQGNKRAERKEPPVGEKRCEVKQPLRSADPSIWSCWPLQLPAAWVVQIREFDWSCSSPGSKEMKYQVVQVSVEAMLWGLFASQLHNCNTSASSLHHCCITSASLHHWEVLTMDCGAPHEWQHLLSQYNSSTKFRTRPSTLSTKSLLCHIPPLAPTPYLQSPEQRSRRIPISFT